MGVWNSHTSVGNILGSLIAGYWVSTCWGLSFVVPGVIMAAMGMLCFLFLIERKYLWPWRCPWVHFGDQAVENVLLLLVMKPPLPQLPCQGDLLPQVWTSPVSCFSPRLEGYSAVP